MALITVAVCPFPPHFTQALCVGPNAAETPLTPSTSDQTAALYPTPTSHVSMSPNTQQVGPPPLGKRRGGGGVVFWGFGLVWSELVPSL